MAAFQPLRTTEPQDDIELCDSDFDDDADGEVFSERFALSGCARHSMRDVHPQLARRLPDTMEVRRTAVKWGGLAILAAIGAASISHGSNDGASFSSAATRDAVREDAPMATQPQQQQQQLQQQQQQQQVTGGHGHCPCASQCHNCGPCNCHGHGGDSSQEIVATNMCITLTCGSGYVAKYGAEHIQCRSTPCDEQDLTTCCDRRQTCDNFVCPDGYAQDPLAASLVCAGANCTQQADVHLCCSKRATCGTSMTCPSGYEQKPNSEEVLCVKGQCSIEADLLVCCQELFQQSHKATCATYQCPSWMYRRDGVDDVECKGQPCTDEDSKACCDNAGSCSDFACPGDLDKKPGADARFCKSSVCGQDDVDICCASSTSGEPPQLRAPCDTMICPSGTIKVADAPSRVCETSPCTSADAKVCCQAPPQPIPEDCSKMDCPGNMALRDNALMLSCKGEKCSDADVTTCCMPKDKPTVAPEQELDCSSYLCSKDTTNINDLDAKVMCSMQGCDAETCCLTSEQVDIEMEKDSTFKPDGQQVEIDQATDTMICNMNCYQDVGATGVEIASEPGKEAAGASLDACRDACMSTSECQAINYRKDWVTGAESQCLGLKDVHFAKCQPGGDYNTEILKQHVMGKCALLGDPHIVQFDRPYGETINVYSTGDYRLIDSTSLTVDARFDFTTRFPTASSCVGVALTGELIQGNTLVVVYTGPEGWQNGFKVWWNGQQILTSYPSDFSDDVLVAKFAEMNPDDYHREARHTIGGVAGTLPSYEFIFKAANIIIYCLLGPDNMNVIIEMSKLAISQDGFCGNFNCDPNDDFLGKLRERGYSDALSAMASTFHAVKEVPTIEVKEAEIPEDILDKCDPALVEQGRAACSKHMHEGEATACLIDVCMANSLSVAALDDALGNVEEQVEEDLEQKESHQVNE